MNILNIYPVSKLIDFFVKFFRLNDDQKKYPSVSSYKSTEDEYESWLGV